MSKFNKIKMMLQSILVEMGSVVTDKGTLRYADDELTVGTSVMLITKDENENDIETVPEDGKYYTGEETNTTIVIENGTITEIIEKEEEQPVEETEVNARSQRFNKIKAVFEESYEEKTRKIQEAIRDAGYDGWVYEAGDDFAVICVWQGDEEKYYRFHISWDGETPIVGEREEVKPAFVPAEEDVPQVSEEVRTEMSEEEEVVEDIVDEIKEVAEDVVDDANEEQTEDAAQRIQDLEALVEELKTRIKELENKPADVSAKEQFKKQNKNEDKLSKLLNAKYADQK